MDTIRIVNKHIRGRNLIDLLNAKIEITPINKEDAEKEDKHERYKA